MPRGIGGFVRTSKTIFRYIRDEYGRIIRRAEFTEITEGWQESYPDAVSAERYQETNVLSRCRCGIMVYGRNKCCRCYMTEYMDYPPDEIGYGTDRADMMAVDARFRLGLISVDWMIDNHVEPTIIVRDGRDQEHEDWWGG